MTSIKNEIVLTLCFNFAFRAQIRFLCHQGDEYESAPGKVTRHCHMHNGICWTHGNFVAHRKRSGVFSFLPVQRTLFFFELAFKDGFDEVFTCTPLLGTYLCLPDVSLSLGSVVLLC